LDKIRAPRTIGSIFQPVKRFGLTQRIWSWDRHPPHLRRKQRSYEYGKDLTGPRRLSAI